MDNKITLNEKYLHELIDMAFSSLVGQIMKRFEKFIEEENKQSVEEILRDLIKVKKSAKELCYEKKRELQAILKAYNKGVKFIISPKTK